MATHGSGVEGSRVRSVYLFEASSVGSSKASRISDAHPDDIKFFKCSDILSDEKTAIRHMTAVTLVRSLARSFRVADLKQSYGPPRGAL